MGEYLEAKQKYIGLVGRIKSESNMWHADAITKLADSLEDRINEEKFTLVFVGEFNRGKSTLLNCLLGAEVLPVAEQETTATINILKYSDKPGLRIIRNNGEIIEEVFEKDKLWDFTALKDFDKTEINRVEVHYPSEYLKEGIEIVDTPGVNDPNEHRMDLTYGFLPKADATIFILDAGAAFTLSEKLFLTDHILGNNISSVIYVLNRIDEIDSSKIASQITKVKTKISEVIGKNEPEVIPVSAKLAFEGIQDNDENKLDESLFTPFSGRLKRFLFGNERFISRINGFRVQAGALIEEFCDTLNRKKEDLNKSVNELIVLREGLLDKENDMREKFRDILDYLATDEESLITKLESSLLNQYKTTKEDLSIAIGSNGANMDELVKKKLPYLLRRSLKNWVERNSDAVDSYFKFSAVNAAQAFEKQFAKKIIIKNLEKTSSVQVHNENLELELNPSEEFEKQGNLAFGTGVLLLGGITIMTGGLGLGLIPVLATGGFIGRNLFNQFYGKKVLEKQKEELLVQLSGGLREVFDDLLQKSKENVTVFYSQLKSTLQKESDLRIKEIKDELNNKIDNYSADASDKTELIRKLDDSIALLEDLRRQVQ